MQRNVGDWQHSVGMVPEAIPTACGPRGFRCSPLQTRASAIGDDPDMDTNSEPSRRPRAAATPVGPATITAEVAIPAELRPGDSLVCQRLESSAGSLLRLGYRRSDRMIRGPVAVTPAELSALVDAAGANPAIREVVQASRK